MKKKIYMHQKILPYRASRSSSNINDKHMQFNTSKLNDGFNGCHWSHYLHTMNVPGLWKGVLILVLIFSTLVPHGPGRSILVVIPSGPSDGFSWSVWGFFLVIYIHRRAHLIQWIYPVSPNVGAIVMWVLM